MLKYQISISPEAGRMLTEHVFFLAQVNPDAAENLRDQLLAAIRSLDTLPERNPHFELNGQRTRYHKMVVTERYMLLYIIEGQNVFVEYVLDSRSDYGVLF